MKKILYTLMLCLISAFAFAQEPAPPSPAKPFTAQFYVSTTGGDTTIYIYKVVQGVVYGWTRLAKSSETNLFVGRTIKGDGTTDITPLNVNMDSTATAINNFLLAKNANGDIVPINANFSTDNNTIIFNGIKINANAGIILNPSIESGKDYFLKTDSVNHMIVRDTNRYVPKYLGADFHVYNGGHKLIIDSALFGTLTKNTQMREGSINFDAPGGRSAAFSAKEYGFFNGTSDTLYYFKAALVADTVRGVKELHYNRLFAMNAPVDTNEVANKKYVDSRPSVNIGNTDLTASGDRLFNTNGHVFTIGESNQPKLSLDPSFSIGKLFYNDGSITNTAQVSAFGATLISQQLFNTANVSVNPTEVNIGYIGPSSSSSIDFSDGNPIVIDESNHIGAVYKFGTDTTAFTDSTLVTKYYVLHHSSGGGTPVTSVSGTTNRITSSGGTTPTIDISSTFEALLGKVANPLSQFASTTSAQLLGVISDESGTGALLFAGSPALTGTPTTPTATGATSTTQIASTAQVHLAIISDTSSNIQNRTGAQNQFSNLAGRIVTNTSNIATNTSNITANTTAIGLKQPRIVGNKPSATSTTYTTADSVTQVLSNLNSGIIANTASISGLGSTYLAKTDTAAMLANYIPKFVTSTIPSKKTFTAGIVSTFNTTSYSSIFPSQTQFYFVGQDANSAVLQGQSFAGHVVYEASRANGTAASPTAIIANDELGTYAYNGWDGTSYGEATASVQGTATQNFTSSAHGTQLIGNTTPNGSTTLTAAWVADQNGDFGIANNLAVGATLGANVSGYSSGSVTATVLSKNNASGRAVLELVGPALNTGNVAAEIDFDALSNTLQSNYKIARIYALPSGSTSGNRGGSINMSTKADNGVLAAFLTASNTQVVAFPHYTTNGGIFYGDGSGNLTQTGAGISTTLLHGGTSPAYSAVSLTADVSGVLPITNIDTARAQTVDNFFPKGDTRWLKTATAATTYVPYTGATTDVALGAHGIGANKLTLAGNASPSYAAGALYFDTGNDALTFFNGNANVGLQIGQEEWVRVVNNTGSSIANGSAVYVNGASGGLPTIALAQSNAAATSVGLGITTQTIANGATGVVTTLGVVHTLNTSAFSIGAIYIDPTTPGGLTQTAPSAPNYRYRIGFVTTVSATVGTIHVTPSTASLGNGTANQLFGMNTGGTAQEVKSIVGSAATGQVVTNATNSITLSNDTAAVQTVANFFPKADGRYVTLGTTQSPTGIKTWSPTTTGTTIGINFNPTTSSTANNQVQTGVKESYTFSDGAFTGNIHIAHQWDWNTSHVIFSDATGLGDGDIHFGVTTATTTNYNFRGNGAQTILNGPGATGTVGIRTNNTNGMTMFPTRNVLFQNGGTATDSTAYRVSIMGRLRLLQFTPASTNDSLMAFNPTTHAVRMTKLIAGAQTTVTYGSGTITIAENPAGLITGTPTIVAGTGAGTSPTVSVTTNGKQLQVTVTTGTLPTGTNATVATVTLPNALSYTPLPVFSSASATTSLLSGASMVYMTSTGTANVTITSGTTALTAATTYVWNIAL